MSEVGAPANAKLLEAHAADAERAVVKLKSDIEKMSLEFYSLDGAYEQQRQTKNDLAYLREQLTDAYELWFKLSKQVREYDKAIDQTRREGEKIPRGEVEFMLTQIWRFQRIAREAFIVGISQDAIMCKDEQDFYGKFAELIRGSESNGIRAGIENEKFPAFVMECYERSF